MPDMPGTLLDTAVQGLAVVGAIALLLIFFIGVLAVKTTSNDDAPTMTRELNRHFLILSAVIVTIVALISIGLPLLLALAGGGLVMATAYRVLVPMLMFLGSSAVLYLILQALGH